MTWRPQPPRATARHRVQPRGPVINYGDSLQRRSHLARKIVVRWSTGKRPSLVDAEVVCLRGLLSTYLGLASQGRVDSCGESAACLASQQLCTCALEAGALWGLRVLPGAVSQGPE